jgi:vacuolar-type H+-ATPase subunit E/Vma4
MSAEKIIEQIRKDTQKQIRDINRNAHLQIKTIKNDMKEKAESEAKAILDQGKKHSENLKSIQISKAKQELKREIMNAKESLIEECFIKAHHILSTLDESTYKSIVSRYMKDGCRRLGKECTVIASRPLDNRIAKKVGLKVTGQIESSGGILLSSKDGRVLLDNTFDGILKREKNNIRIKVGKLLFSDTME